MSDLLLQLSTPARAIALGLVLACALASRASRAEPAPNTAARVAKASDAEAVQVLFAGFRVQSDGTGLVYVELSRATSVEPASHGSTFEYTLSNSRLEGRNSRRPLPTQEFGTNVLRATLVPVKNAVTLRVELRGNAQPTHRIVSRGGLSVLEVEVPAG